MSLLPRRGPADRRTRPLGAMAVGMLILVPILAGCSSTVDLDPAPESNTVACADVIVHLPKNIDSLAIRETDAQGTSAWGSPTAVLLRCGIETPSISALKCFTADGVDWLIQPAGKNDQDTVYTTYGRTPGVQVVVAAGQPKANALFELASAVGGLTKTKACQSAGDATPSP